MQRYYFVEALKQRGYTARPGTDFTGRTVYVKGQVAAVFGDTISQLVTVIHILKKTCERYSSWEKAHYKLKDLEKEEERALAESLKPPIPPLDCEKIKRRRRKS